MTHKLWSPVGSLHCIAQPLSKVRVLMSAFLVKCCMLKVRNCTLTIILSTFGITALLICVV